MFFFIVFQASFQLRGWDWTNWIKTSSRLLKTIKNVLFILKLFPTNTNFTGRGQLRNHQIIHKTAYLMVGCNFWSGETLVKSLAKPRLTQLQWDGLAQCSITPWKYKLNWCHIAIEWIYELSLMIEIGKKCFSHIYRPNKGTKTV